MKNTFLFLFLFISLIARGQFDTLYIINLENRDKLDVIGNSNAPYFNSQILPHSTEFTNVSHRSSVSFPNYVAIWGGSTFGIVDNTQVAFNKFASPSLHSVINNNGGLVHTYIQGLTDPGCKHWEHDVNGDEVRSRHRLGYGFQDCDYSKVFTWSQYFTNAKRGTVNILSLTEKCNSHDTNVRTWDECLRTDPVLQDVIRKAKDPSFKTAIFFFTDERDDNPNNLVPTVLMGYGVKKGFKIHTALNHYGFHRLIAKLYNQNGLNTAAGAVEPVGWRDVTTPPPVDTTKCYKFVKDSVKQVVRIDTTFTWKYDSAKVEIPCTTQVDTGHYFVYGFYEQFYNQTATNKSLLDALIRDVNAKKITDLHCYDVRGLTQAQMNTTNARIKAECPTIRHIIDVTTNGTPHDGFDGVNNEIEPWTWGSKEDSVWTASKNKFTPIVNAAKSQGKLVYWHYGWWNTSLTASQSPKYLCDNMTAIMLHYYRLSMTDYNYMKGRLDKLEATATSVEDFIVYPSYEVIYGQNWPGTMEDWYKGFKVWFTAQNYKKIRLIGIIGFTRQLYNVRHPVPPAALGLFSMPVPEYEGFDPNQIYHPQEQ